MNGARISQYQHGSLTAVSKLLTIAMFLVYTQYKLGVVLHVSETQGCSICCGTAALLFLALDGGLKEGDGIISTSSFLSLVSPTSAQCR